MRLGDQWNWTWAFLAIIVGFQCSATVFYLSLPPVGVDLAAAAFFIWSILLGHGACLLASVGLCTARRFAAISGYWNALPLSISAVPVNMIITLVFSPRGSGRHASLIGSVVVSLIRPAVLMTIAFRHPAKTTSQPHPECDGLKPAH